jgi:hypothetical protein
VEEIKDLVISASDRHGCAASFFGCMDLRIAIGTYPGYVDFANSGVSEIKDLVILKPDTNGNTSNFFGCENLKTKEDVIVDSQSGAEEIKDLMIKKLQKQLFDAHDALRANQVFHTPIAMRKNGNEWDEYQVDAINRTKECLEKTI